MGLGRGLWVVRADRKAGRVVRGVDPEAVVVAVVRAVVVLRAEVWGRVG